MKAIELLNLLSQTGNRVFSTYELAQITGVDIPYASLVAHRLVKANLIRKAERGVYYLPGSDIYTIASNIIYPSYISLFSAFRYYDLTTQTPTITDVITTRRHKKIINLDGFTIRFITIGKGRFFGFHRDKESGAFIAEVEKAIADALYLKNPPEAYVLEAASAAYKKGKLNVGRLMKFLKLMRSKATTHRGEILIMDLTAEMKEDEMVVKS